MNTEVIIVGKGIAGIALSFLLKKKNIDHLVLDRIGRKKNIALAETLPPSAIPLLKYLDLLGVFEKNTIRKTYGYHSLWGKTTITDINFFLQPLYKNGLKINKEAIIKDLEEVCKENIVRFENIRNISATNSKVFIEIENNSKNETITGTIIIDATGRNQVIVKKMNVSIHEYDNLTSFSCHIPRIAHPKLVHDVYVESFKEGWGIVSGLDKETNVVSVFTNKGNKIQQELKNYCNWRDVLSETLFLKDFIVRKPEIKVIGGKANSTKAKEVYGKNWLAIGDAALSFDPLSSHGISTAIYTAKEAADAIQAYIEKEDITGFMKYSDTISSIFDSYCKHRDILYSSETRWADSCFWKEFFVPI